jgi:predicted MFS family arabinose efflux permease
MALVYALVKAPVDGWTSRSTLLCLALSLVLLVSFIINELRAKHPLMPLSIFKIRNVAGADLIQLAVAAGLFSVFFFSSLYLQEILGYSPVRTGLSFLIIPIVIATAATTAPHLIKRIGYKPILVVAPIFTMVGLLILAHVPVQGSYFKHIIPGFIIMAIGLGFTFVSVLVAATSGVAGHLSGLASGLVNTAQQVGGSLGLAVLSGLAASSTARFLSAHAHTLNHAAAATATVHGFHTGFYTVAGFAVTAIILAILVIKQKKPSVQTPESAPAAV